MKTWRDECGVVGVWNCPEAAKLTYLGLYAIQHRGQESSGIVSLDRGQHHVIKALGLVAEVFDEKNLANLPGDAAIGHVRYSTTGVNSLSNAQPMAAQLFNGPLAVAHNGNIVNAGEIKQKLQTEGAIFQGSSDTEVILHLIARCPSPDLIHCVRQTLEGLDGAFSLVFLSHDRLIAARDPYGFRPLVLGKMRGTKPGDRDGYVIASESCSFDLLGAEYLREIQPGEIFWVDGDGEHSLFLDRKTSQARCVFEHVYFSRPDSVVFGQSVYAVRKRAGAILARQDSTPADIVVPVPDSGVPAAIGYSHASGIPFELGIIRNHYIGRTFIEPQQNIRDFGVRIKLNPQASILRDQRVVIIDDSLVRGTTSRKIIGLIRAAGAKEVHLRIAAPPTVGSCYYGVDTPQVSQLIASHQELNEICRYVEADSLQYLTIDGLREAVSGISETESNRKSMNESGYCMACFDRRYPTSLYGLDSEKKEV